MANQTFRELFSSEDGESTGHGELLELRLLEKSARHNFIIARHHCTAVLFGVHFWHFG